MKLSQTVKLKSCCCIQCKQEFIFHTNCTIFKNEEKKIKSDKEDEEKT